VPKFNLEIPHELTGDEAKSRLERFVEMLESRFGEQVSDLEQSWNGNQLDFAFKTFGIKISGAMHAAPEKVSVDGNLPISAMMFKGKIEKEIREQIARLLR
jgi:hypothetical protein